MKAWLIEQLWTDSLENEPSLARGYEPLTIAMTKEAAERIVEAGGVHPGSTWPVISPGTPRRRMRELPIYRRRI